MKSFGKCLFAVFLTMFGVTGGDENTGDLVEARGHGTYALMTHLAFLLAAKVGLYKIVLGIALVVAAMKAMVVMAWALAIFRYAPDVWPTYKHADVTYHGYDKYHDSVHERPIHFLYAIVAKLVVLKIVYGFIFFAILIKGWHFVLWFIHFLKEKKKYHEYIEIDHDFGHDDHSHYHYGHHAHDHHDYGHEHNFGQHGPYKGQDFNSYGKEEYYPQYKKKGMYDADGSYSVKGS